MVDPSFLLIGEVWESSDFRVKLPIRNTSGVVVRVTDVFAGCSCMEVSPQRFTLRPDEAIDVTLKIDLTKRAPWERHLANRPVELDIRPLIEGIPLPSRGWLVEGVVKSRVTLDVEKLAFGDRPVAKSVNAPRTIQARVHGSAGSLEAGVVPPAAGSVSLSEVGPGLFDGAIAPAASLPAGPFSFAVSFGLRAGNGELAPSGIRLPVTGVMQPEIRVFPAQVLLGLKEVGSVAETTVQLQSPPEAGWSVDRVEIDSPDLKIVPDGSGYRIRQRVTQEGDHSAVVRFLVRKGPAGKIVPISTTVSYFGQKAKG